MKYILPEVADRVNDRVMIGMKFQQKFDYAWRIARTFCCDIRQYLPAWKDGTVRIGYGVDAWRAAAHYTCDSVLVDAYDFGSQYAGDNASKYHRKGWGGQVNGYGDFPDGDGNDDGDVKQNNLPW